MTTTATTQTSTPAADAPAAVKIEAHLLQRSTPVHLAVGTDKAGAQSTTGPTAPQPASPPATPATPAQPEASKPPQAESERLAEQFNALMRRDHKIREREAALKATESELAELKALKESLGKDPYATIEKFGGSIEDWSNRLLQTSAEKPRDPAVVKLEKELAELRQWREQETQERSKRQESETRAQQERTMAQFRSEIDDTLSKSDELKALHIAGLGGEVQEVIRAHALKTQEETGTAHLLGIDEAAKYVKAHYLPKLRETLQRLLSLPEFADVKPNAPAKAHTPAAGNGSGDGEASQELEPYSTGRKDSGPNTLTNKTTAIAPPRGQVRGQSSEERWASLVKKYVG